MESLAIPWLFALEPWRVFAPERLPPFNGCGGFLGRSRAHKALAAMVHVEHRAAVDFDLMMRFGQPGHCRYEGMVRVVRGLLVSCGEGCGWLRVPPGFQFVIGSSGGSVPQCLWQPVLTPEPVQISKNAQCSPIGFQGEAARADPQPLGTTCKVYLWEQGVRAGRPGLTTIRLSLSGALPGSSASPGIVAQSRVGGVV